MTSLDKIVAIMVPVTSNRRHYKKPADTDFMRALFPSLIRTIRKGDGFQYRIYLGYDQGDTFFDVASIREQFERELELRSQGLPISLVYKACEGTSGKPVWVWNELCRAAHRDGCDYFYQIGDDVVMLSKDWATRFVNMLDDRDGLGVAAPLDLNNPYLNTQSFVSRRHFDVFGFYFPPAFVNWYCDDWMSQVYPLFLSCRCLDIMVDNVGGDERYEIDHEGASRLRQEVDTSREVLKRWLIEHDLSQYDQAGKRIISFSLWGNDPKYSVGAIKNAQLLTTVYPGWTARFYVADSVTDETIQALTQMGAEVEHRSDTGDWSGLFWRFTPASEKDVEVMLSRDTDSRLSLRERLAVDDWLASGQGCHIMRDHPYHGTEILGGMFGLKRGAYPHIRCGAEPGTSSAQWQSDQDYLRQEVYPHVQSDCMVHDEFFDYNARAKPFPSPRRFLEYVGQACEADGAPCGGWKDRRSLVAHGGWRLVVACICVFHRRLGRFVRRRVFRWL
jgi:hypothetical protein